MTPLKVGHKGAAHLAPGNTLDSFGAALAAGVDMIEFDVLSERPDGTGRLLIAHDYEDLHAREPITLERALEHLAGAPYAGVRLDVDVKLPGYGARVVEALRSFDLVERSLVSSTYLDDLDAMRAAEPSLRVGWSVPRVRRDYTAHVLTVLPALAVLSAMRLRLPSRARLALRAGRAQAIMAHWRVVTRALAEAVRREGGELYVWTVDAPALAAQLSELGVTGIITNDPRIFSAAAIATQARTPSSAGPHGAAADVGGAASLPDAAS